MGYELLEKPLTESEVVDGEVNVVIAIAIEDVIDYSYENLLDLMEEKILDNGILSDIDDTLVGCDPEYQTVHFRVKALAEF